VGSTPVPCEVEGGGAGGAGSAELQLSSELRENEKKTSFHQRESGKKNRGGKGRQWLNMWSGNWKHRMETEAGLKSRLRNRKKMDSTQRRLKGKGT